MIEDRAGPIAELVGRDLPDNPPEGFLPVLPRTGFHMMMGQFYGRMENGALVLGFRCSPRHMNNHGTCHGGMLASFADFSAYSLRLAAELRVTSIPTASLSMEYLRPVRQGDWVESRVQLTKRGRNLIFCKVTGTVEMTPVFTASGIFVAGPHDPGGLEALSVVLGGS
ncbi:thioesterase [Mesorhizobium sp. L-8-10]|uniref:PaaI family thioesterase n=1 Tax=unclassified Mesorhizobium TaxID=325217 RepID=UPI0019284507|nr:MULTISPECIES: PaaI family thioesterase [unclassified Mesorhizobium]BCH23457.1 thioesterase [Mesorhizobium sp. L-8-3]BCH31238.1 thioesterase [Mesorhizobium sp. L-8-10]